MAFNPFFPLAPSFPQGQPGLFPKKFPENSLCFLIMSLFLPGVLWNFSGIFSSLFSRGDEIPRVGKYWVYQTDKG